MSTFCIRIRRRPVTLLSGLVLLVGPALGLAAAAPAEAVTAPYTPWSTYLPGWTDEYQPSSANDCVSGRPSCVRQTLKELARIFDANAQSCSHNAIFSLAYLRITQTYQWSRDVPGYYQDVPFANHQDAVFAKYYTDAYTAYAAGDRASVPQAWQTAFDAARDRRVTAVGDLLLGMNAHINRDLPFVLASVGLVAPDGSSRKLDYDKVEDFLNRATEPMLAEAAQRFDPTVDDANDPSGGTYWALFQVISAGRENAWRNAEALVSAPTPAARAQVAQNIENQANSMALGLLASQAYVPLVSSTTTRDLYCAAHKGDAAPLAYPFGTPTPYGS